MLGIARVQVKSIGQWQQILKGGDWNLLERARVKIWLGSVVFLDYCIYGVQIKMLKLILLTRSLERFS